MRSIEETFPLPLKGEFVGRSQWKLTHPFRYVNPPVDLEVPTGFTTDGASIPKIAYPLIGSPWGGRYAKAAVPHDYRYYTQTIPRRKADKQFIDGMTILGVPWWKKRLMYRVVRLGGWICWRIRGRRRKLR